MIKWNDGTRPHLGQTSDSGGGGPSTDPDATHYQSDWVAGTFDKNDQTREDGWLGIATQSTSDHMAPQIDGSPSFDLADSPAFIAQELEDPALVGHEYSFTKSGWIREIQVWTPYPTKKYAYRAWIEDVTHSTIRIRRPLMSFQGWAPGWNTIDLQNLFIFQGTKLAIYFESENAPNNDHWSHKWQYGNNGGSSSPPTDGHFNDFHSSNFIYIDINSFPGGVNQEFNLSQVKPGDKLIIVNNARDGNIQGNVTSASKSNGYFSINLDSKNLTGGFNSNDVCEITCLLNSQIASDIFSISNYFSDSGNQPSWATVKGFDISSGIPLLNNNAYGIRVKFQPATISSDWDFQAIWN